MRRSDSWLRARGRAREWWGRLSDGDLDRQRQLDRFVDRLQEQYGVSRERAVKELRRRMVNRRASQALGRHLAAPEARKRGSDGRQAADLP
jgi:hypothetical protein